MIKFSAKIISLIFHPLLIPSLIIFFLFNSVYFFASFDSDIKRYILIVVIFSTFFLPLISLGILLLNPKTKFYNEKNFIYPYFFLAICYTIGYFLLNKLIYYPIFKIIIFSFILVIFLQLMISIKWKISKHMTACGSIFGIILAISIRLGTNPVHIISACVLICGLVGTARILINKYTIMHILGSFFLGFFVLFLNILFA